MISANSLYPKSQIFIIVSVLIFFSCKKDELQREAKVDTKTMIEVLATTAKATGDIIDLGKGISDYGHCWGYNENPTISDFKTSLGTATKAGVYTSELENLEPGKLYHIRAYVETKDAVVYGDDKQFTTLASPTLTSTAATAITSSSADIGGNITKDGGATVTDRGVYWRDASNPDTIGTKLHIGEGTGAFDTTLNSLKPNTSYTFKAYAINIVGTSFGAKLSFTTLSTVPCAPSIGSATAGNGQATITFSAPVSNGGFAITGYTVISSPGGYAGTSSESPITVTGLTNGTAYTFTVTATNANGTGPASAASNSVTPSTIPGAPTIGTAYARNGQAIVTFTAPSDDGGSAIVEYTVTSNPGGIIGTGSTSPITVTELTNGTAYSFIVTASNANGIGPASDASNSVTPSATYTTVSDIDGNIYNAVTIGTQVWIIENLRTTKYNDGTAIPNITVNTTWAALITPGYCWLYNDEATYKPSYGALYNWYAVDAASNGGKNACPTGWHVPSDAEWTTITTFLGGESVAGGKLKETGTTHWTTPNSGATNETGFTALPAGYRGNNGLYCNNGNEGYWWSSTKGTTYAWGRYMGHNIASVLGDNSDKLNGFSVRCLRNN